ncbi:MAG TPA: right-handed parallel beta-helix repeat-containing protein, partial [Gaiellaceae bacterium]
HMECIHDSPGSDHITLAGSRLLGCPTESFYAEGTSQTNLLIENNYFDGNSPMEFGCDSNGCVMSNITVRFNSFHGAGFFPENVCTGPGPCATIDGNTAYANIGTGCPPWSVPHGGGYTGSGFATAYNVETVAQRGICTGDSTSKFRTRSAYVAPGPPAFDLRLQPGSTALRAGDPSSHRGRDIQGFLRPLRVPPDAGAAQRETAELIVGQSIGAVSLGMHAADVATAYGLKHPETSNGSRVAHYRLDGRNVWLRYVDGVVAGIETTSPYYTTLSGLGVGSSASDARAADFSWSVRCQDAYRHIGGGTVTYLVPRDAKPGARIAAVTILPRSQDVCKPRGAHG